MEASLSGIRNLVFGKPLMLVSLVITVLGLPLSPFLTSLGELLLLVNFLFEGNYRKKIERFKTNKIVWLLLLMVVVNLVWLINTNDFSFAAKHLKIKIPLLIFPIVIGLSDRLTPLQIRTVLLSFVFATFCGTVVVWAIYSGLYPYEYDNIREISIFISHIRFSAMMVFSIVVLSYYSIINYSKIGKTGIIGIVILILWFLFFIMLLQTLTGWLLLIILPVILFAIYHKQIKTKFLVKILSIALILLIIFWTALISVGVYNFYFKTTFDIENIPQETVKGNQYVFFQDGKGNENGHDMFLFICPKELEEEWNKVGRIKYRDKDKKGRVLEHTLIRYMTSLGLKKDAEGFTKLTEKDYRNVENGYTSYVYQYKFLPYNKVYDILWEVSNYQLSGDPDGKSLAQRLEYLKISKDIVVDNFLMGVGTGNLDIVFSEYYEKNKSKMKPEFRHRAHNQYLTFLISFGFFGFIICIISLFAPLFISTYKKDILFTAFSLIVFLGMINEDSLETQAGVTFFIFFYTLFLFRKK